MNFIGWIRDLFGIQKDMYETKKTRLEIDEIERKGRERLIAPATLDDVQKYDTKLQKLLTKVRPPRVDITYDVESESSPKEIWLKSAVAFVAGLILGLWFKGRR